MPTCSALHIADKVLVDNGRQTSLSKRIPSRAPVTGQIRRDGY